MNFSIHRNENEIKFYRLPADAYFKELWKSFEKYLFCVCLCIICLSKKSLMKMVEMKY